MHVISEREIQTKDKVELVSRQPYFWSKDVSGLLPK